MSCRMRRWAHIVAVAAIFTAVCTIGAPGQERRQGEPGRFDFYVLALSWSPSYCEAARDRRPNRAPDRQCAGRPFAFVVHGLWPQYERGFPSYCQVPAPRLDRAIVGSMLDVMPSPVKSSAVSSGTIYFETVRKAQAAVKIPPDYLDLSRPIAVAPGEVADAFVKANPGLSRRAMAVSCDGKRLTEVRVCLAQDLSFHDCPEISRRACRLALVAMPAVRGSR